MKEISTFAPGRIEVLGNHTDYNLGHVLSCAIPLGIGLHARLSEDERYSFTSEGFAGEASRRTDAVWTPERGAWGNYALGVLEVLREEGVMPPAFHGRFESTVPPGAGLSSSAAMEVATAYCALMAAGERWGALRIARACRRAENVYAGVQCGLLDQLTSVAGRRGKLVHIDFQGETYSHVAFPKGHVFLVFGSGVGHTLVGGEYNERRSQCYEAAEKLGAKSLREISMDRLQAGRALLEDVVYRRALHIVGENQRVDKAVGALEKGDVEQMGRLMKASHESSRLNFENSTQYLDVLVEIASATRGVYGARLTGGGFGGAIVALARSRNAQDICAQIERAYATQTGKSTFGLELEPWDGGAALSGAKA